MFRFLWERYFIKETLKVFVLFLFCFYFLYVLIDYSAHMQDFIQKDQIPKKEIVLFYLCQFVKRADILFPLALLVATIKVLTTLNARRELVALQTAGLRAKVLLRPFLMLGLLCTFFLYGSLELALPKALNFTDSFHKKHSRNTEAREKNIPLRVWHLQDGSKLIYQKYDPEKKAYFDVFWIRSAHDIWRMKYLSADPNHPLGNFVDHIQRNKEGELEKVTSFPSYVLHDLKWGQRMIRQGSIPVENRSISSLTHLLVQKEKAFSYKKSEIQTLLLYKIAMPLLALLIPIAVAPYCIRYSRQLPIYVIYAISLLAYVIFYTLMDATVILGKNQVMPPLFVVAGPMVACFGWFSYQFVKNT